MSVRAATIVLALTTLLAAVTGIGVVAPNHSPFDRLLAENVRDERVDYDAIGRQQLKLFNYLASLAGTDPATLPRDEQLAYYINLYNATMIHEVLMRRRENPQWTAAQGMFAVFRDPVVVIKDRKLSLNELEHEIIRAQFKDPRIHAALVCAAESCPPLLPRAYRAEDLDEVLEANMKRFVLDRTRNPIDDEKKELKLSQIFNWYAGDFGGRDKLAEYVGEVAGKDYSGYTVSFVDYSWQLNEVPR